VKAVDFILPADAVTDNIDTITIKTCETVLPHSNVATLPQTHKSATAAARSAGQSLPPQQQHLHNILLLVQAGS
jgi:hypothetical protein